jgi:hypothetical protein
VAASVICQRPAEPGMAPKVAQAFLTKQVFSAIGQPSISWSPNCSRHFAHHDGHAMAIQADERKLQERRRTELAAHRNTREGRQPVAQRWSQARWYPLIEREERLREVALWKFVNQECIYGASGAADDLDLTLEERDSSCTP